MATVRPIRSEADYDSAMERIDALMALEERTSEQRDEMKVLALVIEDHERSIAPIDPPDPIEAIKFRADQAGLTAADLAPYFGSRNRVYEVLNGQRNLTISMIRALNKRLGIPADILLGRSSANLSDPIFGDWKRFPVLEMVSRGWIPDGDRSIENFLAEAFGEEPRRSLSAFRHESRENPRADPYSLMAWCAQAMRLAGKDEPLESVFDPKAVDPDAFLRDIAQLSVEPDGPLRAVARMRKAGIRFVALPRLKRTYLDAAAMQGRDGAPLVALSLHNDRLDSFWFCLLHELAHVMLHIPEDNRQLYVDDMSLRRFNDRTDTAARECEADDKAQSALIPHDLWTSSGFPEAATTLTVIELARQANVHPSVVAGRVRFELGNYRKFPGLIGSGLVRRLLREGICTGV